MELALPAAQGRYGEMQFKVAPKAPNCVVSEWDRRVGAAAVWTAMGPGQMPQRHLGATAYRAPG